MFRTENAFDCAVVKTYGPPDEVNDKAKDRGVVLPPTKVATPRTHTLGEVWDTQALSHHRASAMRGL